MAGYSSDVTTGGRVTVQRAAISSTPKTTITKDVSYVASGTKSNQIISFSGTDSDTVTTALNPKKVVIYNTGEFPVVAMIGYQGYSDEDTVENTIFLHTLLLPGESITPNQRGIISTQGSNVDHTNASFADRSLWNLDGEVVDFTAPNTALKVDITDNVNGTELANTTDPVAVELDNGHEKYRIGDYIRIDDTAVEILKVIATYDDNLYHAVSGHAGEGLADNHIVVSRGHFGTSAASHSGSGADLYWPLFNEYHDYDRVLSGNTQLVQTDSAGKYKSSNFFGYGRVNTTAFGLVPGSICIRFYSKAYQEVMMGGTGVAGGSGGSNILISPGTDSKLAVSTSYSFSLVIDDSSATEIAFTTDSSNTNFGGNNGIISKMQSAIDTATRTVGNGLFGYSCSVGIANGKLRFTSNSHLSPHDGTNGSKITLGEDSDSSTGANLFTGALGIFPDINEVDAAIPPKLPELNIYNPITYAKSPNMSGICYDDSNGRLLGAATGTINYETGAINILNAPSNAEFEVSVIHNSPFGGKLDANKTDVNAIKKIHANALNKNMTSSIKVEVF